MTRYADVLADLRRAYDGGAQRREAMDKPAWKRAERDAFIVRMREAGAGRLLEVGAGTGQDAAWFRDGGLDVVATDLSSAMVAFCRAKGLVAHQMDFLHLEFPDATFDAVHAMNCLLHVPDRDLPDVLAELRRVLRPGGLLYVGVYGGDDREGPAEADEHVPARFFSSRSDATLLGFFEDGFEVVDFHVVAEAGFQSLTVRRPLA